MEVLFELLLHALWGLAEIGLQLLFELLAEVGLRSLREPFRPAREVSPWLAAPGYLLYGTAAGALSLWVMPDPFLDHPWARVANLALTPLLAGAAMALLGSWRRRRGQAVIRLDRFSYGTLFALGMAVVRFIWAQPQ
jgi:hypothetical protein